jgi:hypothetical protein
VALRHRQPRGVVTFVDLDTTPVIARGCLYVADSAGDVAALDMNTGALEWKRHVEIPETGLNTGALIGAPFVDGGRLIRIANAASGPYAIAMDASTGAILWTSPPVDTYPGAFSHASPVVHRGVLFAGFSGPEGDPVAQGGFALLDAATGVILSKTYTVPEAQWGSGGAGGGIWSTPAVDPASGYAFFGSGSPFSKPSEHDRTNAILKVDLTRSRSTFGQVVAGYKAEIDQAVPLLRVRTGEPRPRHGVVPAARRRAALGLSDRRRRALPAAGGGGRRRVLAGLKRPPARVGRPQRHPADAQAAGRRRRALRDRRVRLERGGRRQPHGLRRPREAT